MNEWDTTENSSATGAIKLFQIFAFIILCHNFTTVFAGNRYTDCGEKNQPDTLVEGR